MDGDLSEIIVYMRARNNHFIFIARKAVKIIWNQFGKLSDKTIFELSKVIPDKCYLEHRYRRLMGRKLNLNPPVTYNEKLNWIKLYDRNPIYTMLADKYAVREYVKERIGEEYLIPLLGVWNDVNDIDFEHLPNQFVLKCTHDSESVVICKDKKTFNIANAKKKLRKSLKINFFWYNREWVYKNIPRKIIAEQYMEDNLDKELKDYKFFCFDGIPKAMFIATGRSIHETKFDFFDMEFNHLNFTQHYPNSDKYVRKPSSFELMKKLAMELSRGLRHVRVDFYEVNGKVYFGEITFFHHGGTTPFDPDKWDYIFGDWLRI